MDLHLGRSFYHRECRLPLDEAFQTLRLSLTRAVIEGLEDHSGPSIREVLEILGELAAAFEQFYPDVAWSSDEGYA